MTEATEEEMPERQKAGESDAAEKDVIVPLEESMPEAAIGEADKDEEEPMIEIHAPHESIHTWKDILIHIGVITVGLLLAVGLEQVVEYFHHRHQVAETRAALDAERQVNIHYFATETEEIHRILPLLRTNLAVYQYLREHPGAPASKWPGEIHWLAIYPRYVDAVWKTAQANDVLRYMPQAEVRHLSVLYDRLTLLTEANQTAKQTKRELFVNNIEESDPAKLTSAQLDEQIRDTARLIRDYSNCTNEQSNINRANPDFVPSPDINEFYKIVNITIPKHDYEVVLDEVKRMRTADSLEETEQQPVQPSGSGAK